jgi:hypothetical protein
MVLLIECFHGIHRINLGLGSTRTAAKDRASTCMNTNIRETRAFGQWRPCCLEVKLSANNNNKKSQHRGNTGTLLLVITLNMNRPV